MDRRRGAEWWAWAITAATLASQVWVAWTVWAYEAQIPDDVDIYLTQYVFNVLIAILPALGAVILRQFPRHPIGWILVGVGAWTIGDALARVYAMHGLYIDPGRLPGPQWAAWLADWNWVPGVMVLLLFVPLLFPDGRLPGPRWRPVAVGGVAWIVLATIGSALVPEPLVDFPDVVKPVQVPAAYALAWLMLLIPVAIAVSLASVAVRRRRALGDEREQLRWLMWALGVAVATWTPAMLLGLLGVARGWGVVQMVLLLGPVILIPVTITIAIVKYRLYDIDTLINRTLLYGALTASVLAAYAVVVLVISGATGSTVEWRWSVLVVAGVAILAYPLREWLQRRVNRLMYGDRDDPDRALSLLSQRISDALSPTTLLPATVEAIAQALRLPYVAVRLARETPSASDVMALAPTPGSEPPDTLGRPDPASPGQQSRAPVAVYGRARASVHVIDLVHQGELVGTLEVGPRSDTEQLSGADLRLLDDAARQVALAAHAARLAEDLQESRERLVLAREEERRRLRRDLHDQVGSALAGLALQAGNARAALPDDPVTALRWVGPLEDGIRVAVADVRRIVDDLRPPALDELGLAGAIRQRAEALFPGSRVVDGVDGTALPAAVEVAAYRIAIEALANVARHAPGTGVGIRLDVHEPRGILQLEVNDDGPGLPAATHRGVGLRSMRERAEELGGTCVVECRPTGGTVVRASLPIAGHDGTGGDQ